MRLDARPRFKDQKRLLAFGAKSFCQCDEDGILAEIFKRIGTTTKRFIEFGVGDARVNNTILLLLQGWSGAWIDSSADHLTLAVQRFKGFPIEALHSFVTIDNADALITKLSKGDLDLLSIDVDGNDYWLWKAITTVRPRVVVIEYNAIFPPEMRKTIAYNEQFVWNADTYFGASLGALEALGREKQYSLVGCSSSGVNAFFVRSDCGVDDKFAGPFTAQNHYEPARYILGEWSGYPVGSGRWVAV
jgi:hypothetical protein